MSRAKDIARIFEDMKKGATLKEMRQGASTPPKGRLDRSQIIPLSGLVFFQLLRNLTTIPTALKLKDFTD